MARVPAIAALALAGCVSQLELDPPEVEGARGLVLAVEEDGGGVRLFGLDDVSTSAALAFRTPARVTLLYFDRSLQELQIPAGPIALAGAGEVGRALPEPHAIHFARVEAGRPVPWGEAEALEPPISELRLPPFDPERCSEGCIRAGYCATGCGVGAPEPPDAPIPANLLPCPEGWEAQALEPSHPQLVCRPTDLNCPTGQVSFLGDSRCTTLGRACPVGQFADGLPGTGVLYVDPAASGGTGSEASPLASLTDALDRALPGTIIALSKGEHGSANLAGVHVELRGACAEATVIASPLRSGPTLHVETSTLAVRDLTLRGGDNTLVVRERAAVDLEGVRIEGGSLRGIYAIGTLTARRTIIGGPAEGVLVERGGRADVDQLRLEGLVSSAWISGGEGTHTILSRTLVRDVSAAAGHATGVEARDRGVVELGASMLEAVAVAALSSVGGATLAASQIAIRDMRSRPRDRLNGEGVSIHQGAVMTLDRISIEHALGRAVWKTEGKLTASDVVTYCTRPEDAPPPGGRAAEGHSLEARQEGHAGVTRWTALGDRGLAIVVERGTVALTDFASDGRCEGIRAMSERAAFITNGARLAVQRVSISGRASEGLRIIDSNSEVTGTDLELRDISGSGLEILTREVSDRPAMIRLDRLAIEDVRGGGLIVRVTGEVHATNVSIIGSRTLTDVSLLGRGIELGPGAELHLTGFALERLSSGLRLLPGAHAIITGGALRDNGTALETPTHAEGLSLLEGNVFSGNEELIELIETSE